MTLSNGPIIPHHPGGPSRVIQGFFPGGQPRLPQPATAGTPPPYAPPPGSNPLQAHPAAVQPAIVPGRFGAIQPASKPGFPASKPQPILPGAARPGAVQPFTAAKPAPPQPILPAAPKPAAVQPRSGNAFAVPPSFHLRAAGTGQRLPEAVQQKMEEFFGTSFADVRVHVGNEAFSIGASAFTHGADLYFAPGQYNPQTPQGQRLLGHELTHVVQQRAGRVRNPLGSGVAVVQDPALEAEAERMSLRAATMPAPVQAKFARPSPAGLKPPAPSSPVEAPARTPFLAESPGRRGVMVTQAKRTSCCPVVPSAGTRRLPIPRNRVVQMGKKTGGKKDKFYKKGEKGGVNCYLNGSKKPIPQGENSNVDQHAEKQAVRKAVEKAPTANIALEQNAWPCSDCDGWLQGQATEHNITITVTVTADQGGYSQDHGLAYGATGNLVYQ